MKIKWLDLGSTTFVLPTTSTASTESNEGSFKLPKAGGFKAVYIGAPPWVRIPVMEKVFCLQLEGSNKVNDRRSEKTVRPKAVFLVWRMIGCVGLPRMLIFISMGRRESKKNGNGWIKKAER